MTKSFKPPAPVTDPARTQASPRTETHTSKDANVVTTELRNIKSDLRVNMDPNRFENVIKQHGKHVTWRKALSCPCITDASGQPEVNCPACDSSGWLYVDPIHIQAHMLSFDKSVRSFEKIGMWLEGSTSVTTLPQHRLGYRDSLELRDLLMSHAETFKKGNRRGFRSFLAQGTDCARYRVVDVEHMQVLTTERVPVSLELGVHYELTPEGWIRWLSKGNALVPDDKLVSIRYCFRPVYVVESHPHAVRDDLTQAKSTADTAIALPIQAVARLDYLVQQKPLPSTGSY